MKKFSNGQWYYRPDSNFQSQIGKMAALDEKCGKARKLGYRINGNPTLFKFCQMERVNFDSSKYVPGIISFREQVRLLWEDPTVVGPDGGNIVSFGEEESYLSTTQFAQLAGAGLIGSSGTGTDLMWKTLNGLATESGAVTAAVLNDPRGRRRQRPKAARLVSSACDE